MTSKFKKIQCFRHIDFLLLIWTHFLIHRSYKSFRTKKINQIVRVSSDWESTEMVIKMNISRTSTISEMSEQRLYVFRNWFICTFWKVINFFNFLNLHHFNCSSFFNGTHQWYILFFRKWNFGNNNESKLNSTVFWNLS
jgi:hypothetical protein